MVMVMISACLCLNSCCVSGCDNGNVLGILLHTSGSAAA